MFKSKLMSKGLPHYVRPRRPAIARPSNLLGALRRQISSRGQPLILRNIVQAEQRRMLWSSPILSHGHVNTPKVGEELWVTFIDKDGERHKIAVVEGDNLLDIAQAHDLEMEGACGGSCACSTCHVIVEDEDYYERIPEPDDDENDMLDLAFGLTETSRLGCQVQMTKELDGIIVRLPSMTRNLQVSDFQSRAAASSSGG